MTQTAAATTCGPLLPSVAMKLHPIDTADDAERFDSVLESEKVDGMQFVPISPAVINLSSRIFQQKIRLRVITSAGRRSHR